MILAILGACLFLVYDIIALAGGIGLISQIPMIVIYALEITIAIGFLLIGLGFHELDSEYNQPQCRIAFFGFILASVLELIRVLPQLVEYDIWFYFISNLVVPWLGAIAFFNLRSEGTVLLVLTSIVLLIGPVLDLLAYLVYSGGLIPYVNFASVLVIRSIGRIPMWVLVGATFAWFYRKNQLIQSAVTN